MLCTACLRALHPIDAAACSRCQGRAARLGPRCSDCAGPGDPLTACLAAVWFEGEASRWIRRFKYPRPGIRGLDPAARAVVGMLALRAAGNATGAPPQCIVPVPLHPRNARQRGFNPAALLARQVARRQKVRWDPVALRRIRETRSQTALTRSERLRNVAGAFRARRRLPPRIWLVDDVVTTGATLCAAARAARAAGAREVVAICAARTPTPDTPKDGGRPSEE